MSLNKSLLSELFWYDPAICQLRWKVRPSARSRVGVNSIAGCVTKNGYRQLRIGGRGYFAHQLVWIMCVGDIPAGMMIDHIDGDRDNNDVRNLRLASKHENQHNAKKPLTNTSGFKNVTYRGESQRWVVQFRLEDGRRLQRKFRSKEAAIEFADKTREQLHGDFANHGVHRCEQ